MTAILQLPQEQEIKSIQEICVSENPKRIQKTIRFRDGTVVVLIQDFNNSIFSVQLRSDLTPFRMMGNRVLK